MVHRWWAGMGLALTLLAGPLAAQGAVPKGEIKGSSPNPITSTATIEFEIKSEACRSGTPPLVTMRIYNVLVQVVATPELEKPAVGTLENVRLPCGTYKAKWDGLVSGGQPARTGVYYAQLTVDGQRITRKLIVKRKGESR